MHCRLLVKNISNTYSSGDVIHNYKQNESPGRMESKTLFMETDVADNWPRQFVIVNVIDATPEDYEYLLECSEDGHRIFYIQPQDLNSPFYQQLLDMAEVSVTKEVLNPFIMSRI